ncbi:hypothetical protein FHH43_13870, partial [Clostridium perfringens]|nr:hypothetical protein [Clostridium perfringens]
MFDLKRCVIKMASNIKVVESRRGKVIFKSDLILKGLLRNKEYEEIVESSIKIMKEINKIEFFYDDLKLVISYDWTRTSEKRVVDWLKLIIEVLMDNYEEVKNFIESNNKEGLIRFIEPQLKN